MKPTRRSSLFLMELMLAILLFVLAAAICVQVFVKSHTLSTKSTELSHAVLAASSVAEIIRSDTDYQDILMEVYPMIEETHGNFTIGYNDNWQHADIPDATYVLQVNTESVEYFRLFDISVYAISDKETSIYEIGTKKYIAKEDSHEN